MSARIGGQSVSCPMVDETYGLETYGPRRGQETLRSVPVREPAAQAVPARSGGALLDRSFGRDDISVIRHEAQTRLIASGFRGDRLHGFVLAVNEVITNVVLHAGGQGRIEIRVEDDSVWCTVTDSGPGIPQRYLRPPDVPEAFEVGGRGIWLAYALCDEVTMATGPIGTTLGLRMARPSAEIASGLVNDASAAG